MKRLSDIAFIIVMFIILAIAWLVQILSNQSIWEDEKA